MQGGGVFTKPRGPGGGWRIYRGQEGGSPLKKVKPEGNQEERPIQKGEIIQDYENRKFPPFNLEAGKRGLRKKIGGIHTKKKGGSLYVEGNVV